MSKIFVINVFHSDVESYGSHDYHVNDDHVKSITALLKEESEAYKKEVLKKICDDEIAKRKWGENIKFTYNDNVMLANWGRFGIYIELIPCELVTL